MISPAAPPGSPRVGHDDVEAPAGGLDLPKEPIQVLRNADIAGHGGCPRPQFACRGIEFGLTPARDEHPFGTFGENRSAVASPIPELAPVTTAVLRSSNPIQFSRCRRVGGLCPSSFGSRVISSKPDEVFVQPLRCQRVHRWRASGFDVLWLCGCVSRFVDASIMPRIARAGAIAPCVSAPV